MFDTSYQIAKRPCFFGKKLLMRIHNNKSRRWGPINCDHLLRKIRDSLLTVQRLVIDVVGCEAANVEDQLIELKLAVAPEAEFAAFRRWYIRDLLYTYPILEKVLENP